MKRFVAKDLMVSVLPAEGAVAGLNCGGCTCTNKGSEKPPGQPRRRVAALRKSRGETAPPLTPPTPVGGWVGAHV
jgi:hypothetical protein